MKPLCYLYYANLSMHRLSIFSTYSTFYNYKNVKCPFQILQVMTVVFNHDHIIFSSLFFCFLLSSYFFSYSFLIFFSYSFLILYFFCLFLPLNLLGGKKKLYSNNYYTFYSHCYSHLTIAMSSTRHTLAAYYTLCLYAITASYIYIII